MLDLELVLFENKSVASTITSDVIDFGQEKPNTGSYTDPMFVVVNFPTAGTGEGASNSLQFNIQDCDAKEELLACKELNVEVVLVNGANEICWKKTKTLNKEQTQAVLDLLKKQSEVLFAPDEFDVNVAGLQSAYEPFELEKFAVFTMPF